MKLRNRFFKSAGRAGIAAIFLLAANICRAQGFLKASGRIITDEKGNKVILRGMGLGGWMLQEGYMFRVSNLGQQYKIREKIAEVAGEDYAARFYDTWLKNHTRKIDIDSMASWGFNSIRLPMHYALYTLPVDKEPVAGQNTWLEKGFELTDNLLKWCKANHMYLILDLHAAPGGQGNDLPISDRDPAKPSLWESKANQDKMIALWKKLAQRYANEPYVGGYDIINEPNWGFEKAEDKRGTEETKNAPLRQLMVDVTKAIREVDNKHIIIIEGNGFGNNYRGIFPLWDNNTVVSFHKYGNFNNVGDIQKFLDISEKNNVPLWMGESGENFNTWYTEAIQLVESHNIGWSWWQEKKMDINNPLEIKVTPGYQQLLNYWAGKGEKPSREEAIATLDDLLAKIKLEQEVYHKDVIDAMFREVRTTETKPFKDHYLTESLNINAVDYDMGRQRYAYMDKDTASYHYTPGVNTTGNKGRAYRNDGVDIQADATGYQVFSIEDGEWLQYTVRSRAAGKFNVELQVASEAGKGKISLLADGVKQGETVSVIQPGKDWSILNIKGIKLKKGINKIQIYADEGGFDLKTIKINKAG
ncbi:cellulase family glycosylhydrolase [Mucilaginibacter sp. RS28]|uniref:Cellulase family glycosylhydrolase n=1 Tax=Mucilaginibacter straminoryzae TaxID=2932774 RepID=A0A9X2BE57_9SPHI|nr:cellulase family glycosylhydrolase [Mucilaginibacter straminoryzae]MCJ8211068.1 cellulase family glycosylhydrolase [Mucilaginibacter straminoryzae]